MKFPKILAYFIGGLFSIGVLVVGLTMIQGMTSRAEDQAPRDVVVTDITTNSVRIVWTTGIKNQGVVEYGTSPTSLNLFAPETENNTDHKVDLTLLSSNTAYYFQINIAGKKYDNAGVPWTFSTKGVDSGSTNSNSSINPTPISTVRIPNAQTITCDETDCNKIKLKIGQGCTTQDYFKCIRKLTPTVTPTP